MNKSIIGYKIGCIEVISDGYINDKHIRLYECKCNNCGSIFYQTKNNLIHRLKGTSCKNCKNSNLKTHGMRNTKIYSIWKQMKHRCNCSKSDFNHWKNYAGRNIIICNGWNENNCYASGRNKLTIDRIDNSKGYLPENCRIISHRENQYNKRNTIFLEYNNEKYNIMELSKLTGLNVRTIYCRLYRGWNIDDIINKKSKIKGENKNV